MNKKKGSVALLALSYNSQPFLKKLIASVRSQTYKNCHLIIIDNNSSDGSVPYLHRYYPHTELILNEKNLGVGGGYNIAIQAVLGRYDYIGLLNPDVVLDKNWVTHLANTLEKHKDIQACGGLVLNWNTTHIESAGGIIVNLLLGVFGGLHGGLPVQSLPKNFKEKEHAIFFSAFPAFMVKTSAFKKYGLFDADYFMSSEEVDLCWRIWNGGERVLCNPKAYIRHYIHGSNPNKKISLYIYRQTELNILLTYYKNLQIRTFIVLIFPLIFIRTLLAFSYIYISPRITISKLKGIYNFFPKIFSPKYLSHRRNISKIRKKSDWQVLKNNPTPLLSFKIIFFSIFSWFKNIRITFKYAPD